MSNRARTAALGAMLAVWFVTAATSNSAQEKGGKVGPYNADILKLVEGKGSAEEIAKKAELGDVMQAFKPRSKGGLGIGPTPDAIKPDGIEQKLIDLGKSKRGLTKADLAKQGDALARAAEATKAISDVALFYADKDGKKNPTKWKQFAGDMKKSAEDLATAAHKSDADAIKKSVNKLNASCNDCHADFRD
jgi:cytochrome c556